MFGTCDNCTQDVDAAGNVYVVTTFGNLGSTCCRAVLCSQDCTEEWLKGEKK